MKSKLPVLLLGGFFATAAVISSGTATIPGTFEFDFDAGTVTETSAADVFWEQFTSTTRALEPANGATIANIGVVNFDAVTLAQLQALSYGTAGLSGTSSSNVLVPGDVFAVQTNAGNFTKVVVTGPFDNGTDNGLPIQWQTYSPTSPPPVPIPTSIILSLTGIGGAGLYQLMRRTARRN